MKPTIIAPGATIGMLGGGQLGRMTLLAGLELGYRFHVFDPAIDTSAGRIAHAQTVAAWSDLEQLEKFANQVDVVSLEFENIPVETLQKLQDWVRVSPSAEVLHICQNRKREKEFLRQNGFPCADFRIVRDATSLQQAVAELGFPVVLKTADFGYDGKGQIKITTEHDWEQLWLQFAAPEGVVEKWIPFIAECSLICARTVHGEMRTFPMAENEHREHILHRSIFPARFAPETIRQACDLATELADKLQVVGLLTVELFLCADGSILVNELAPRPHNSGHFTINGCRTSQFEQLVRAVCGLPLGDPSMHTPGVMVNLLGDIWHAAKHCSPDWELLLREPGVSLHLYDKGEPRCGRKMGHFTVLDERPQRAIQRAEALYAQIQGA